MHYRISVFLLVLLAPTLVFAQSVCTALLNYGVHDEGRLFNDSQSFSLVRSTLCRDQAITYQSAQDAETTLGIPIFDVLEINFGSTVTEDNFSTLKDQFCFDKLVESGATQDTVIEVRKISEALTNAFERCVANESGFYAFVKTQPIYEAFTIEIKGNPEYSIESIDAVPPVVECSVQLPNKVTTNRKVISCSKPPDVGVVVSMQTSQGAIL